MRQRSTFNSTIFAISHVAFFISLSTLVGAIVFSSVLIWKYKVSPHDLINFIYFTSTKNGSHYLATLTWGSLLIGALTCFAVYVLTVKFAKKNYDIHHRGSRFDRKGMQ